MVLMGSQLHMFPMFLCKWHSGKGDGVWGGRVNGKEQQGMPSIPLKRVLRSLAEP